MPILRSTFKAVKSFIPEFFKLRIHIFLTKLKYLKDLWRIWRKVRRGEKIRVLFIVSEIAKWKCQSLYDEMKKNCHYHPVIGVTIQDRNRATDIVDADVGVGMMRAAEFYEKHGCEVVFVNSLDNMSFNWNVLQSADIVFYQQPWNIDVDISPCRLSRYALTAYIPYFVPNYYYDELTYGLWFHHYIKYYFVLNGTEKARSYRMRKFCDYAGETVVVGHTALDNIRHDSVHSGAKRRCVIYAPHFTFSHPQNPVVVHYSTFLQTGEFILKYAQAHREFDWVFKPHPVLEVALTKSGVWTKERILGYYNAWAKIGRVCDTGDYYKLFHVDALMITDCGSFLTEFGATGKPIIHLINPENIFDMPEYFKTYYQAHNLGELQVLLTRVLECGDDYKQPERIAAIEKANLTGQNAAKNIMDFFDKEFKIKR